MYVQRQTSEKYPFKELLMGETDVGSPRTRGVGVGEGEEAL